MIGAELADPGFAPAQRRVPALVLPMCPPDGSNGLYVIRPEAPRVVKAYRAKQRPNPVDVFTHVTDTIDRFIDFNKSLAEQHTMAEMAAIRAAYLRMGRRHVARLADYLSTVDRVRPVDTAPRP